MRYPLFNCLESQSDLYSVHIRLLQAVDKPTAESNSSPISAKIQETEETVMSNVADEEKLGSDLKTTVLA